MNACSLAATTCLTTSFLAATTRLKFSQAFSKLSSSNPLLILSPLYGGALCSDVLGFDLKDVSGGPVDCPSDGDRTVAEESIAILRKRHGTEMADAVVASCSPARSEPNESAMHVEVDFDETQVFELGGKRWKQDDVAKEMLTSFAEDAASKAAGDQSYKRLVEHLDMIWHQWETFERKCEKIAQLEPGSKEGLTTLSEHRMRTSVQTEMEIWAERMEKEDKIMTNKYETLNLQVVRLSQEIFNLKERHKQHFAAHVMPKTFTPTRVELKGWWVWRNIRGTGITMDEARTLVSGMQAMMSDADLNKFTWELTDRDQGNFEFKMMAFLWFNEDVTPQTCAPGYLPPIKRVQTPIGVRGDIVRATHEIALDKRPWNKTQVVFLCALRESAGLPRETFDIKCVSTGIRVSVNLCLARFVAGCFYHNRGNLGSEP